MASNPGVIQLPADTPLDAAVNSSENAGDNIESSSSGIAIVVPAPPTLLSIVDIDLPAVDLALEPIKSTENEVEVSCACAVMECMELAACWCDQCHLNFCQYLHAPHMSHSRQQLKDGIVSKSAWAQSIDNVSQTSIEPISLNLDSQTKKRKERAGTEEHLPAGPICIAAPIISAAGDKLNRANVFRLEGDNQVKRAAYESEKLSEALEFIQTLQSCKGINNYDGLYGHFNYENYYDVNFLCELAKSMCINISDITCKRRFTRKELLDYVIKQII